MNQNAAIAALESALANEKDDRKKSELQRALDSLKRQQNATDSTERPDFRDQGFKQIANEPESGEELGNAIARTNRDSQQSSSAAVPDEKSRTQPPVEAGNINVQQEDDGAKTVTVKGGGQPSKPADVPAHTDKK